MRPTCSLLRGPPHLPNICSLPLLPLPCLRCPPSTCCLPLSCLVFTLSLSCLPAVFVGSSSPAKKCEHELFAANHDPHYGLIFTLFRPRRRCSRSDDRRNPQSLFSIELVESGLAESSGAADITTRWPNLFGILLVAMVTAATGTPQHSNSRVHTQKLNTGLRLFLATVGRGVAALRFSVAGLVTAAPQRQLVRCAVDETREHKPQQLTADAIITRKPAVPTPRRRRQHPPHRQHHMSVVA